MNIDTGHLVKLNPKDIEEMEKSFCEQVENMNKIERSAYEVVPTGLAAEAERELAGKNETFVDLTKATPLAAWAAKKRAERKKTKNKRKVVKASRKRNMK